MQLALLALLSLVVLLGLLFLLANRAGYRITGISKKFPILLALLVAVVVGAVSFWPRSDVPVTNTLYDPAFASSAIANLKPGWTGRYVSALELRKPISATQFTGLNFAPSVGLPMELQFYVPSSAISAGFAVNAFGYVFIPVVFITPGQPTAVSQLEAVSDPSDPSYLVMGFPQNQVPTPGRAYTTTALLYWRSDSLVYSQTRSTNGTSAVPVFLADGRSELQPAQLRAPATQNLELGLRYREADQELTLHRIEWSAGQEVRMLVTLRNLTNRPLSAWAGISGSSASLPAQPPVGGSADGSGALGQGAGSLPAQGELTGYVVFPRSVADPTQLLTLRMPTLGSTSSDESLIILRLRANGAKGP